MHHAEECQPHATVFLSLISVFPGGHILRNHDPDQLVISAGHLNDASLYLDLNTVIRLQKGNAFCQAEAGCGYPEPLIAIAEQHTKKRNLT